MSLLGDRTKGEQRFIHEYTRTLLVKWAAYQLQHGSMPVQDAPHDKGLTICLDYAISKHWVTKDGTKVTSTGFERAAGRLKG
jgi:hypothetical protein